MQRIVILQGEHAVSSEPGVVLSTLLGSCVAVCLHDPQLGLGGMNHFLLGDGGGQDAPAAGDLQRYGVHAMEVLINALLARGAERTRLKAHCYGGANMVSGFGRIGSRNVVFIRRFLAAEGFAVMHSDLGGRSARRVEFLPHLGRSRCSHAPEAPAPAPAPAPRRALAPAGAGEVELF